MKGWCSRVDGDTEENCKRHDRTRCTLRLSELEILFINTLKLSKQVDWNLLHSV